MAYRCAAHKKASLSGGSVGAGAGGGRGYGGPDRISRLPDELLHHILSFVTTPEAARISALSRRWVGVWKRVPRLHLLEEEATKAEHIPDHYDGILRRYAADVDIADLAITYHWDWPEVDGDRASAWAGFAAWRVTGRFDLAVTSQVGRGGDDDARPSSTSRASSGRRRSPSTPPGWRSVSRRRSTPPAQETSHA